MNDREAIIELARAVELFVVSIANNLVGTINTTPSSPIVQAIRRLQALIAELESTIEGAT